MKIYNSDLYSFQVVRHLGRERVKVDQTQHIPQYPDMDSTQNVGDETSLEMSVWEVKKVQMKGD